MSTHRSTLTIGYCSADYAHRRNIINRVPGLNYRKTADCYGVLARIAGAARRRLPVGIVRNRDFSYRFLDFDLNGCDLIHFFNAISYGKTPWVTTFETVVPRFDSILSGHHGKQCGYGDAVTSPDIRRALEVLSGNACRTIIAMSDCSRRMQTDLLSHFPEFREVINNKLVCLHPPQASLLNAWKDKKIDFGNGLNFLFVGGAFFTKGGKEILEALIQVRSIAKRKLNLTIVSSFALDGYATKKTGKDVASAQAVIEENKSWITHHDYLPNENVLELMKSAHVGLLPSYAETYGYALLEMQACGCPVISTNVRAFPEINNNEVGWVIDVPKNRLGEAIYTTAEERELVGSAIREGLVEVLLRIVGNPGAIEAKADAAIQRIRQFHSPADYSEKLKDIYYSALA